MCVRNSYNVSDYVNWDALLILIRRLYDDGNYKISLLVSCGCFFGLRISDIRSLTWNDILDKEKVVIVEKKTKKRREIMINPQLQKHILSCYISLKSPNKNTKCFLSQKKTVYTTQSINRILKKVKREYDIKAEHFSTHSLRKSFGREIVESAGKNAEFALIKLSELFNHSNTMVTRRYLGLRKEELLETYKLLRF
ncbi:Phage integrase family protein [Bacteroides finegoldii]|jgi:tyrosine type site-specific recombinase|uniref:Tyr recombinase domain-containing protein n=1 Tax=Bacteroides finegoldii CL09T03C10 TaxID=997888 RepID=K5CHX1_9BACE|nr:tyrosine-type recombinase/integrase [Bacteroides finegoldii]EKJ89311.1 hypothetical protein HMPREF1057_04064 [Bacteroides finegoldii CL09T03C10]